MVNVVKSKTIHKISKFLYLFDARSKKLALLLVFMIFLGVVLEMFGIGIVIPLITLFSSPEPLKTSPFLGRVYDWLQPESETQFIVWNLAGVILLYVVKNTYLIALAYIQNRFILARQHQLGTRLFRSYLYSPYQFHLKCNSSELLRNVKLTANIINSICMPLILCITEVMVVFGIFIFLLWVDPFSAAVATLGLVIFLGGYTIFVRKKLTTLGEDCQYYEGKTYQQINQSLGAIKEVKTLGRENFFSKTFSGHLFQYTHAQQTAALLSQLGRYIAETIVIGLILGIMIFLLNTGETTSSILITFSLFAVAAMRVLPSINRLNWAFSVIRFGIPSLDEIFSHLKKCEKFIIEDSVRHSTDSIIFDNQIEFRNVSYKYRNSEKNSLESFSLVIPKKSKVALVGASGAGKSTAIDLILGLLKPSSGDVLVDGKNIHESLFSWQQQIGYVPQSIYVLDDTIQNNVAFGVQKEFFDKEKVWAALRLAQLDSFVKELPNGLDTMIGENGVLFSGGQRQRIGIARALYHEPKVLIMDEATAALDNETEYNLINSIENLSGKCTVIWVAHRISTVKNCDVIFFLNNGRMIASGSYDSLVLENSKFAQMFQEPINKA
jgi:ABC-type multidrug transport system fused ATPase/permease subunit